MLNLLSEHLDIWTGAPVTKANGGRGRSAANQSPYGIKKLRELILELAVRGMLVAQNPNDEPASVLLEKIAKEKARLTKEGKIKKERPLSEISEEEKPFDLPNGWEWTRLGQITQINPRNEAADELTAAFVSMPLISTSHTGEHGQEIKSWGEIKTGYTHFADGDIGVAKITPCFENSKAVVFCGLENGVGAGTTELHIARPFGTTLVARYILLFLKSPMFLHVGGTKMTGTAGQKRLPKEFFSETPLPLPPLAEQHRIVAKVDELMALCDRLEQQQGDSSSTHQILVETLLSTLTTAPDHQEFAEDWQRIAFHFDTLFITEESIDQLKQSILQLAVQGKLVPQDSNDDPASILLEKITKEKSRLIKEGKIKKQKPLPEISEDEKLFELPVGWGWAKFGVVFDVTSSKRIHVKDYVPQGVPFFRSKEVGELQKKIPISTDIFISNKKFDELRHLPGFPFAGDIMLTSVGSIGNTWICDGRDFYYKDGNITKIGSHQYANMHYAQYFIDSPLFNSQVINAVSGTAYNALTIVKLNNLVFPLPPLAEQHRIVAKVDELMALCDQLKAKFTQSQVQSEKLIDAMFQQLLVA